MQTDHLRRAQLPLWRLTLAHALRESGADLSLLEPAFEAFYAARNQVECYSDSLDALQRIAARMPVAAITNGNADLQRIGLTAHFAFHLGAREHGAAKPDPGIFLAACTRLGCMPAEVLHVGDHVEMDVAGAVRAGLRACWLNRVGGRWEREDLRPDLEFVTLTELADWVEAQAREDGCGEGL
ncbi:HAD family hydrolase [Aromatoleum aromaticum]|uniref:Predicted hydrolase n=1 Tax=Aromatoleum aromaticum (strain DSM 19018 / LMG 30748 / EbN1) TaxID=76114 RepID=Q5P7Y5_AROAE|nr:HAD-IA family hydrolase [Aromatoleum aromaticum]NMG55468.1 HAD-IA family hydrolase [Aromatoleum aromaticum]CAI06576.1 predicted hydrolase, fragment [Aromatoleum aromaticum EbN1]